jgi:hypothetical protein
MTLLPELALEEPLPTGVLGEAYVDERTLRDKAISGLPS